jgi:hypothetical protein
MESCTAKKNKKQLESEISFKNECGCSSRAASEGSLLNFKMIVDMIDIRYVGQEKTVDQESKCGDQRFS